MIVNANHALIEKFYLAFQSGDGKGMAACYHEDIAFSDPLFTDIKGIEVSAMWHMFLLQAHDLTVTCEKIQADQHHGHAVWTARYSYGKARRKVVNRVKASFVFKDGKIIQHTDMFSLWKWIRMTLGPMGWILGWNKQVQTRIQQQAVQNLKKFMQSSAVKDL